MWSHLRHGWKTITGAVIAGFGVVADPSILHLLPHKVAAAIATAGSVLTVIGLRHAVGKAAEAAAVPTIGLEVPSSPSSESTYIREVRGEIKR